MKEVSKLRVEQRVWTDAGGWSRQTAEINDLSARLVLLFGCRKAFRRGKSFQELKALYPDAYIIGCSTAGEISGARVLDNSLVSTAVEFKHTKIYGIYIKLDKVKNSFQAGVFLPSQCPKRTCPTSLCFPTVWR